MALKVHSHRLLRKNKHLHAF